MQPQNFKKEHDRPLMFEGDNRLRTLVENLPGIVFRCKNDKDLTMRFISRECEWLTGHTSKEFCTATGITWASMIHPLDRKNVRNIIQKAVKHKEKFHLTYRILDSKQKIHWVKEIGIAVENKEGDIFLEGYLQDITEQISGGKINMIRDRALNEVGNGIVISNAQLEQFPIIYVNKAFERITGYTQDEVIGRHCNFLQSDERDQKEIRTIRKALLSKSPCRVDIRNYRKDGSLFWNELSITPILDENGEVTHFMGIQNDITPKKNLELIRKVKNQVLEMVIRKESLVRIFDYMKSTLEEQLRVGIIAFMEYDEKGQKLRLISGKINPTPLIQTLDHILSKSNTSPSYRVVRSKKKEVVSDIHKESSWSKYSGVLEETGVKGTYCYPLLDAENNILGVLSIFCPQPFDPNRKKDELLEEMVNLASLAIEKKRVREKLKTSREQIDQYSKELEKKVKRSDKDLKEVLKKLMETNFELITQTAEKKAAEKKIETQETLLLAIAEKFPKGVILLIDNQMRINFIQGSERHQLQTQHDIKKTFKIADLDGLNIKNKILLQKSTSRTLGGEHLSFEMENQRNVYAVNTSPLLKSNGDIQLALVVMFNISDRKRNEELIYKNLKKEKELSKLKSRFISTASHEFRTPLSIILSSTSLIEKLNTPEKAERRLFHLARIKSNVQHLSDLLNDFLSLTKLEEGATKAIPGYFDLIQLSRHILKEMEMDKKHGQSLKIQCDVSKLEVHLDPKLVRHILLNLLSNAIKYSGEGQPILLKIEEKDHNVIIWVIDQGIGIPEEEKQHIFKRFFRAKNSMDIAGTGLGLHIIKSYSELMGGILCFESKVNQGSSFELELPKNI